MVILQLLMAVLSTHLNQWSSNVVLFPVITVMQYRLTKINFSYSSIFVLLDYITDHHCFKRLFYSTKNIIISVIELCNVSKYESTMFKCWNMRILITHYFLCKLSIQNLGKNVLHNCISLICLCLCDLKPKYKCLHFIFAKPWHGKFPDKK